MKNTKQLLSFIALSISLSLSPFYTVFAEVSQPSNTSDSTAAIQNTIVPAKATTPRQLPSLAPMLEQILPAVVTIQTQGSNTVQSQIPNEFRHFFPFLSEQQAPRTVQGLGSGVIINAQKGYIVTNHHVVNNAEKINIELNNGQSFPAKLIGKDAQSDIAVLQIENPTNNLKEIRLANSDELRVGDFAVAIGNPFGIGQTVTSGIVSALARSGLNVSGFENFIQTDASINRGNSGGALVNLNGELIGINTAIIAPNGGNVGIGFAIPSNMVQDLATQIIEFGEVQRGLLGIKGLELTSDLAKAFKLQIQKGAFVAEIITDSPAEKAGIQAGDVITSIDNRPINNFSELRARIATMGAGKNVVLGIVRDNKELTINVTLQSNKESSLAATSLLPQLSGAKLTDSQVDGVDGVKIESIEKDSFAARLGLKENDMIVAINSEQIKNIADFKRIVDAKPSTIALKIMRGKNNIYLILRS